MNDQERKLCAMYIPNPKDRSLKWNEYYILDVANRVQRVTIMGVAPWLQDGSLYFLHGDSGAVHAKRADPDDWVRKGYLYDNRADCQAGAHDCYDDWEVLRELQADEGR